MGTPRAPLAGDDALTLKFDFHLANAAMHNGANAKVREATRMACMAYGLHKLGHDVNFVGMTPAFGQSARWPFFSHIGTGHRRRDALQVRTMEELQPGIRADVAVKCTVKAKREALREYCDVLVAHEASDALTGSNRVVDVPFLIHDDVIIDFIERGLFQAYLDDDVETIRAAFDFTKKLWVGFRGTGWPNRVEFFDGAPEWVDVRFHPMGQPPMSAWSHCEWLASMRASPALAGDTPKTNLPPTLALLGTPIIAPSFERNKVPLDTDDLLYANNAMIWAPGGKACWHHVRQILEADWHLKKIADAATIVYKAGWSPIGQARLIAAEFGA